MTAQQKCHVERSSASTALPAVVPEILICRHWLGPKSWGNALHCTNCTISGFRKIKTTTGIEHTERHWYQTEFRVLRFVLCAVCQRNISEIPSWPNLWFVICALCGAIRCVSDNQITNSSRLDNDWFTKMCVLILGVILNPQQSLRISILCDVDAQTDVAVGCLTIWQRQPDRTGRDGTGKQ